MRPLPHLLHDLEALSLGYRLSVARDYRSVIAHGFKLPPGYGRSTVDVLFEVPRRYPRRPPGVASRVYLPPDLRFHGRTLKDVHPGVTPGWGNWAWLCYEWIRWDPRTDDLIKFLEMVRADLTNPSTK
ncbi:MAG: hypothetical protein KAS72_11160 [Phycisphaerales bacterium]|nr:hypothetical protein [Phycisphaerales bacterium]